MVHDETVSEKKTQNKPHTI